MTERNTGGRDELGQRLRALRKAAGKSGLQVAADLTITQSRLSRAENGRVVADPLLVETLCRHYGASAAERRELVAMARDVRSATRRLVVSRDIAGLQARLGRVERQSRLIRTFSPSAIPGELQTEAYVRAIFTTGARRDLDGVAAGVRQRLLNQAVLADTKSPRRFVFLIPEFALGWSPLPAAGMAAQVEHLAEASTQPNVRVGILPWGRDTAGVLPLHSWHLFDARFVVVGFTHGAFDLAEEPDVTAYVDLTDQLERLAVFGDAARAVLARVSERYRAMM